MGNYLDQTLLAYALRGEGDEELARGGLNRVERHYQQLYAEPLVREVCGDATMGMALWRRPNPQLLSPLWAQAEFGHVASTSALTGWDRIAGDAAMNGEPAAVGAAVLRDPATAARLDPPFALGVHSRERMVLTTDAVGAGRLFELEWERGWVWSNRLGALHLFAGLEPRADERAWAVLAATGWFLGELTAIEGARQLRPTEAVEVERSAGGVAVSRRRDMDALHALVGPRRSRLRKSAKQAADGARSLLRDVGACWDGGLDVDLSGGRDSRVSAAAAIAVGAEMEVRTQDLEYGELDVVQKLLEAAPTAIPARVEEAEREPDDTLLERAANLHLAHDGMRNPQSLLRAALPIPHPPHQAPAISGHGGELGHGFYYGSEKALAKLSEGGDEAAVEMLVRAARKRHEAATPDAYAAFEEEVLDTFTEGATLGVTGPALLDYYYLSQRLANRSGITTRNDRWSACSTLAFVRACFDLSPEERLEGRLHREIIGELVPQWRDVPFFEAEASTLKETKQVRIWEKAGHSEELARMIAADGPWQEHLRPEVIREMWDGARAGEARNYFEPTFTRVAWRETFEDHLRALATAAAR